MTVSTYEDIRGYAAVYERLLNLLDFADEPIEPLLYLAWGPEALGQQSAVRAPRMVEGVLTLLRDTPWSKCPTQVDPARLAEP